MIASFRCQSNEPTLTPNSCQCNHSFSSQSMSAIPVRYVRKAVLVTDRRGGGVGSCKFAAVPEQEVLLGECRRAHATHYGNRGAMEKTVRE